MAIILLLYFIAVLIFFTVGLVGIFHAVKFKMPGDSAMGGTFIFIGVSSIILIFSIIMITSGDWNAKPELIKDGKTPVERAK